MYDLVYFVATCGADVKLRHKVSRMAGLQFAVPVRTLPDETTYYLHKDSYSVIPLYEHVITFDQEISKVWRRKFTMTSLLLLSNRYALILTQTVGFLPFNHTVSCCTTYKP